MFFKQPPSDQPFIPIESLPKFDFTQSLSFYCQNLQSLIVQTPSATYLFSPLYGIRALPLSYKWHPSQALLSLTNDPIFINRQDFKQLQIDSNTLESLAQALSTRHTQFYSVKRTIEPLIKSQYQMLFQKDSTTQALLIETEDEIKQFELQEYFSQPKLCLIVVLQKSLQKATDEQLNFQTSYEAILKQCKGDPTQVSLKKITFMKVFFYYRTKNPDSVRQGPFLNNSYQEHVWSDQLEKMIQTKLENAIKFEFGMFYDEKIAESIKQICEKHK